MGANATTSVPSYVAGEVLTAADLNVTNSGIPVFADSTARTNGFGGTGEKTLAEGQYAYLEDDNKTYVYDGAAWKEVGGAGLVLISSTTIGSAVSSVTVSNCFSSTYDHYKITVNGGAGSTPENLQMQLGASTTGYYDMISYINTGTPATPLSTGTNNGSIWARVGAAMTSNIMADIDLGSPNLAKPTYFRATYPYIASNFPGVAAGYHNVSTAYTGFTLSPGSGTLTGGVIRVYGYQNS